MHVIKQELVEGKLCSITLDPTDHFKDVNPHRHVERSGRLLMWGWTAVLNSNPHQRMKNFYTFSYMEMPGKVSEDGVYTDLNFHPIASIVCENAAVYIYEYSMVAVVANGVSFVIRMD